VRQERTRPRGLAAEQAGTDERDPQHDDGQFKALAKIIYDRAGIHFPETKKYIVESRLGHRLTELELDGLRPVHRVPDDGAVPVRRVPGDVQPDHDQRDELLPQRAAARRVREADPARAARGPREPTSGCASGRRRARRARSPSRWRSSAPDAGRPAEGLDIEILGTDISERARSTSANTGEYTSYAMRSTPTWSRAGTSSEKNGLGPRPEIRSMVNFELHNLKDTLAPSAHGTWDVIFCRNVMIYFDDDMKKRSSHAGPGRVPAHRSLRDASKPEDRA
jgi:chemotaxis protein methyltransferase CheR